MSAASWMEQQERLELALRWGQTCGMSVAEINEVVGPLVSRVSLSACWRRVGQRISSSPPPMTFEPRPEPALPGKRTKPARKPSEHSAAFLERRAEMEWAVVWGYLCGMKSAEIGQLIGRSQGTVCITMNRLIAERRVEFCRSGRGYAHKPAPPAPPPKVRTKPPPEGLLEMCRTHSLAETGRHFGLTGERVRQLAVKHGVKREYVSPQPGPTPTIRPKVLAHPDYSNMAVPHSRIARDLGVAVSTVATYRPSRPVEFTEPRLTNLLALLAAGPLSLREIGAKWPCPGHYQRLYKYVQNGYIQRLPDKRYALPSYGSTS